MRQNFKLALPIFIYILHGNLRVILSCLGESSQAASLEGLFILIPLALICSRFAAMNKKIASYSIALVSLIAVIHYTYFLSGMLRSQYVILDLWLAMQIRKTTSQHHFILDF